MRVRRELRLAVLLCLLGSGLTVFAVTRSWATVVDSQRLTIDGVQTGVSGRDIAPQALALGYVGLAGVLALAATRRLGRVLVGALLALVGVTTVVVAVQVLSSGVRSEAARVVDPGAVVGSATAVWVALTAVGGLLLALSGALVAVRGRTWASLSSSYEPPAAKGRADLGTDKGAWDALDRGEDPTS